MSDIYPTGRAGSVHPDRAGQGRARPRHLPSRRQRPASRHVAPAAGHLPDLRQGRDHDRHRLGRRAGLLRVPRAATSSGRPGAGASGWISPFGGTAKLGWNLEWAAQWSLFGVTIEPNGKDLSTAGGSRDRSGRDRARGLRARAAAQRPVRVPQHRRQEDVDVQGPRRGGPSDRRGRPAGAAPLPVPAAATQPRHRLRSGWDGPDPAPLRRVRQVRGGDGRT